MASAIIVGAFFIAGCSEGRPTRVPVAGRVLIDGQPVKSGYIRFMSSGARASGSRLSENGEFSLSCFEKNDGAVLGTHQITVNACESIGRDKQKWHAPKKYGDITTSGLTQEIKEPVSNLDINLTWDGGQPFIEIVEGAE